MTALPLPAAGWPGRIGAYVALTKPRIVELLLVTTVPAMVLAARGVPSLPVLAVTLVAGSLAAGGANALNSYVDRDIDQVMRRTRRRPLPRQTVGPRAALAFGAALSAAAVVALALATNLLAAGLTLAAVLGYVFGYTLLLKRRTSANIVWGGAAGCAPVLIGEAAVTGRLSWAGAALFLVVFFWTPPHFWALALRYREDYAAAGVPMLPVVAAPVVVTTRIVRYAWLTVAASLALWPLATGWVYGAAAVALGAGFLVQAHRLHARVRAGRPVRPMALFHLSNGYLALLFAAVALDTLLR